MRHRISMLLHMMCYPPVYGTDAESYSPDDSNMHAKYMFLGAHVSAPPNVISTG